MPWQVLHQLHIRLQNVYSGEVHQMRCILPCQKEEILNTLIDHEVESSTWQSPISHRNRQHPDSKAPQNIADTNLNLGPDTNLHFSSDTTSLNGCQPSPMAFNGSEPWKYEM